MSAYITKQFIRLDSLGEVPHGDVPPSYAFFGVPVPMLTVDYWKLKTNIPFGWEVNVPLYWCAEGNPEAIKKQVVERNITLIEAMISLSESRTAEYKANPAKFKLDVIGNTPMTMTFLYATPNANKSGIVGQYTADFNVAPRFRVLLGRFYDARGRFPNVIFDDYQGEPRILQNDPRGPNSPALAGLSVPPPEYRFESDGYGIKCPMWAFLGACQVDNIVHFTDGGPRFVSEEAYFQFRLSLWYQCAPFTGIYKQVGNAPQPIRVPEKAGMISYGKQPSYIITNGDNSVMTAQNSLAIDYIGHGIINMYSPMFGFSNTLRPDSFSTHYWPMGSRTFYAAGSCPMWIEGMSISMMHRRMCGDPSVEFKFSPVYVHRQYINVCVPVLRSVAEKVGEKYRQILDEANGRAWEMIRAGDKADVMGLVGFVFSAVGMFFGVQAISGLFGGNISLANLSGTLKMSEKFGIDTGSLGNLVSLGNTLNNLSNRVLSGISSLTQSTIDADGAEVFNPENWAEDFDANAPTWPDDLPVDIPDAGPIAPDLDTPITLPEDSDMWDETDPWGDIDAGYGQDWTGWYEDSSWYDNWGSSMDEWAPGWDEWYSVDYGYAPDALADITPGLTPSQVATANGATAAEVAEINAISSQAAQSTDYWATFQNLLKNASSAVMQIGGMVLQYKQAEIAFDRLKGGNTTLPPQYATRPTQVGVPVRQPDGSISTLNPDGSITTIRPNGQQVQTPPGGSLPSFARFFTPKNMMIGGAVIGIGVLGFLAFRQNGSPNRRRR